MMQIAIVDDERVFLKRIQDFLEEYLCQKNMSCEISCFTSGEEVIRLGKFLDKYDIFFLDVDMPKITGVETAKIIRQYSKESFIVFVTAYIDYSIEGYKVNAIRYILKENEFLEISLKECMDAILKQRAYIRPKQWLCFVECEMEVFIDQILYVESHLHQLIFHIQYKQEEQFTMYQTLNRLENEWEGYDTFLRVHQSYLVNLKHIRTIRDYTVILDNNEEIRVPKARYGNVKRAFVRYKRKV